MKNKIIALVLVSVLLISFFPVGALAMRGTSLEKNININPEKNILDQMKFPAGGNSQNNLVAHYKFDGNLKDSSTYGNDGKVSKGNITYVKGKFDEAAKFDGKSFIEVLDNDSLDLDTKFTISVWLCKEEVYNDVPVLSKGLGEDEEDNGGVPYILWHDAAGTLPTLDIHGPDDWARISHHDELDNFNTLHMITFTLDIPNKEAKLYLNGQLFNGEKIEWEFSDNKLNISKKNLFIGVSKYLGDIHYFNGYMDDLRIYNKVLTASEISALYIGEVQETKEYESMILTPDKMAIMKEKGILYINVIGIKPSGLKEDITTKTIYKSSNENIITVDKQGKVVATGKGIATITATYGNLAKEINLTVK